MSLAGPCSLDVHQNLVQVVLWLACFFHIDMTIYFDPMHVDVDMLNIVSTCQDILCVDINVDKRCVDHSTRCKCVDVSHFSHKKSMCSY